MSSLQQILRPARRSLTPRLLRSFSTAPRLSARVGNAPPVDPPPQGEMGVGELEGLEFKIQPLRRVGEDAKTMRARLVYQSRKRGTLESDLLLSTFADKYLPTMTLKQMAQYDKFLDENDWDIYYWATQETPSPAAQEAAAEAASSTPAESTSETRSSPSAQSGKSTWSPTSPFAESVANLKAGKDAAAAAAAASEEPYRKPGEGEWAQTVGTFRPAYRPVPARWKDSEVLEMLREHVKRRSKGGAEGVVWGLCPF
ncbi:Flavinator of succinate dehydrogenase-domain-containing protein [Pseudomassariella vexata]|uniref:Succinate dehydrogenase assembly factor 2, mitochondrial n=1 Tax=Pseudomassariella vexata TaxID=1141098 RepID=A0A1Y2E248_9PEZI|nr:Flavinator of succinate dehydrogenase-domain-containing protein [Pseudomassariella vexata]ORY65424.1 Flavinator of succinate dehydrogenase-domain-containing protein [Pseudomassariella vexata]